jgi:polysaccharide pyruvyl transferase WcaK-like protein
LPPPVTCPSINIITSLHEKGEDLLHVVNYTTAGVDAYDKMCEAAKLFSQQTGRTYREVNNRISKGSEPEMDEILKLYRKSGFVISSALHGCIIAVAMGLKVLAVSGDRKIDAFMESIGLGDWVLDLTETDRIFQKLNELHLQKDVTIIMEQLREKNKNIAKQILLEIH